MVVFGASSFAIKLYFLEEEGQDVSIVKKIKKIIPKSCFGRDKVFDKVDNDHLNMSKVCTYIMLVYKMMTFQKIAGLEKLNKEGNEKIIQHCMPLMMCTNQNLIPSNIMVLSVHKTLYQIQPYFNQQNANFL